MHWTQFRLTLSIGTIFTALGLLMHTHMDLSMVQRTLRHMYIKVIARL